MQTHDKKPKRGLRALVLAAEAWGGARLFYKHAVFAVPVRQCWVCKRWVALGKRLVNHLFDHARAGAKPEPGDHA